MSWWWLLVPLGFVGALAWMVWALGVRVDRDYDGWPDRCSDADLERDRLAREAWRHD